MTLMGAGETLECWLDVINQATTRIGVLAFTFDLPEVLHALLRAQRRGCDVILIVDETHCLSRSTRLQNPALAELADGGVNVYMRRGVDRTTARRKAAVRRGHCHAKFLMNEKDIVIGSCNFTRSSLQNVEVATRVCLSAYGRDAAALMFRTALMDTERFMKCRMKDRRLESQGTQEDTESDMRSAHGASDAQCSPADAHAPSVHPRT